MPQRGIIGTKDTEKKENFYCSGVIGPSGPVPTEEGLFCWTAQFSIGLRAEGISEAGPCT
jgi:hypothetical protein